MKKYSVYLFIVLGVFCLNSCGDKTKSAADESGENSKDNSLIEVSSEQFNAMKMEISPLDERAFDYTIKTSGLIDVSPKDRAKVTSYIGGYIKSILVLEGDQVKKGQALLTLESPEFINLQQSYLEVASQLEYLKSEYERQKTLFDEKISSQKKYLEAESNYRTTKATYQSLRQRLSMLRINPSQVEQGNFSSLVTIYSPISGDVTSISGNLGMAVSTTDVVMEIVDAQAMYLELSVFEKDIYNLNVGQKIAFVVPQIGSETFNAQVTQIGKAIEGSDRIIKVFASLDADAKQKLITGMFIEAQLVKESKDVLSAPIDAIATEESNSFLLVLTSEKDSTYTFKKTLVKTGERNGDWVEIISNKTANKGTKILTKGVYDVM